VRYFADLSYTEVADVCAISEATVAATLAHAHADLLRALAQATVRLLSRHHSSVVVSVGKSGTFSTRLPPGRYGLEAGTRGSTDWPMGSCQALFTADQPREPPPLRRSLLIRPSRTTHVGVGCLAG
jgi:hypothetical protein